jgi:hypothetical protein
MRFGYPGVTRDQAMRWRLKRIFKVGGGHGEDLNGDDDDDIADATHAAALHHLFHTRAGSALMRRVFPNGPGSAADVEHLARLVAHVFRNSTRPAPRDPHQPWPDAKDAKPEVTAKGFPMNRADELESLVKRAGSFAGLCRRISSGAHGDVTEWELATMGRGYSMKRFPELTGEQAFAKQYGDECMSDEARAFWDACETLKQAAFTSDHADDEDEEDDEESGDALDELHAKAVALRKRMPHLSEAQCFDRVYSDSSNRELAKRERRQNGF